MLSRFPEKIAKLARESFAHQNVEINEDGYVDEIRNGVILQGGRQHYPDLIFVATGARLPAHRAPHHGSIRHPRCPTSA